MLVINNDPIAYFDVDDTLIMWDYDDTKETVWINGYRFNPHKVHIEQIKKHKMRGHTIIVYSAGGSTNWAEPVIKALKLEDYVDVVMPKANWAYDDLPANEFMKTIYLEDE
jgi:phosphoserine phosphatase